ncbi:hypothetical protein F5887DRAFT_823264, partial [Amanita rubescens]
QGADIPDIEHVIQFGSPRSLSIWIQQAGRAGRARSMLARATMLVERSVFQRRRKRGGCKRQPVTVPEDPLDDGFNVEETDGEQVDKEAHTAAPADDGKEWVKSVDSDLRTFLENNGTTCRCYFLDEFFDNPPRLPDKPIIRPSTPPPTSNAPGSTHSTPTKNRNSNGKRPMTSTSCGQNRRGAHLQNVHSALENWRYQLLLNRYSPSPVTCTVLLPDPVLMTLASHVNLKTVDDLSTLTPPWIYASRHGQEVLDLLQHLDSDERQERE